MNSSGSALVYSTYLGGSGYDDGYGIAVDSSGNAYVTGATDSTNFPTTPGVFQTTNAGVFDVFVTKLNAAGSALVYSTYLGGSGSDPSFSITLDSVNNAYITGYTDSSNFPTASPFQAANGGGQDVYVTKLNPTGSALLYSTYLGGSSDEQCLGIAIDPAGNAYVTGATFSTNFPTMNPVQASNGGGTYDAFVAKITDVVIVPFTAFLHGSGATANPPTLFLNTTAPTATAAKYKDSPSVNLSGGNPWKEIGAWDATPAFSNGLLTALSDRHVWLGLKNSDDQGTNFDLRVEVWKNRSAQLVAVGETYCITGVTRNPDKAKEVTGSFNPFSSVTFNGTTDVLSLVILTRVGTNGSGTFCGGHSNAVGLRLYFDAVSRNSRFNGTFSQ